MWDDGEGLCRVGIHMGTPESPWRGMCCGTPISAGWWVAELGGGTGGNPPGAAAAVAGGDRQWGPWVLPLLQRGLRKWRFPPGRMAAGWTRGMICPRTSVPPALPPSQGKTGDTHGAGVWPDGNWVSCEIAVPISLPPSAGSLPPSYCWGRQRNPRGHRGLGDPSTHPNHVS